MAGEVVEKQAADSAARKHRKRRRVTVRIDMTSMVDIAFLLLIFYMVTTVFSMPQAIEVNLPPAEPGKPPPEVLMENVLTVRVDQNNRFWWHLGLASARNVPQPLTVQTAMESTHGTATPDTALGSLLVAQNLALDNLNTLVLIHPDADFETMVTILDEIELSERIINQRRASSQGITVEELPTDWRFSYRYAVGDWDNKDNRIARMALDSARQKGVL